jgi:phi13 family phage major tail protein
MGKVVFGISDVAYCVISESTASGVTTLSYGTPTPILGAVSLSLDIEGDTNDFYADNGVYASFDSNNGLSGDLEIANVPESVYTDLLGYYKDTTTGLMTELASPTEAYFGLMCKVSSNEDPIGFKFYKCALSRPAFAANTTTESIEPDTQTLAIRIMPIDTAAGVSIVKSHQVLTSASAESTFFGAMALPTIPTA